MAKISFVDVRVGHVSETHVSFGGLRLVSQVLSTTTEVSKLTRASNSPVKVPLRSATSIALVKCSVEGCKMPRAST